MKKVELLAPAGNMNSLKAAVMAGCDAVYLGGMSYGARAFSKNFDNDELVKAIKYCHLYGVKVYVTVNTLIYENEVDSFLEYIEFLHKNNVDAVIIQDFGMFDLVRKTFPNLELHASTQMHIHNLDGTLLMEKLGMQRVVLARETSIDEIKYINENSNVELEVFVHGALCYAYSGNCLMSYAIGKRSGNRGACAQPCRKKYTLLENNKALITNKSIISMKDLSVINNLDQILSSGVTSLKIEGRMKSLEYVQTIVSLYRKKIDEYYKNTYSPISTEEDKKIKVTFNRGFTKGYLLNDANIKRTDYNNVNHQGILIGKVISKNNKKVTIKLYEDLSFNDGIRFKGNNEYGAYVNEMFFNNKLVKYVPKNNNVTLILNTPCNVGDNVYKTVDIKLQNEAKEIIKFFPLKANIEIKVDIKLNKPLRIELVCYEEQVVVEHTILTEIAKTPLSVDRIESQLLKLNDTLFNCSQIDVQYDNKAFFTIKDLNELRRLGISKLEEALVNKVERIDTQNHLGNISKVDLNNEIIIDVVVNSLEQYNVCQSLGIENIYFKDNYSDRFQIDLNQKGFIHNLGQFLCNEKEYLPSIYMNVVNDESIELLNKLGFESSYLSTEVSVDEVKNISKDYLKLGYFVYGREDLMVSNQCFIASSLGYEDKKCGMCLKNKYEIIDEYNNYFPVLTDFKNCDIRILNYNLRNEIFNIKRLINYGIKRFLLIFTIETEDEIIKAINLTKREIQR